MPVPRKIGRAASCSALPITSGAGSRSAARSGATSVAIAGSLPLVRQGREFAQAGGTTPAALSFATNVLAGSAILVFVQDVNFNGSPMGTGAPYAVTVEDSQGGTYTNLGYVTTQILDAVSVLVRKNVSAGALAVTCNWTTNQWHGLVVAEIQNVGTNPTITLLGGNEVFNPAAGSADAISTLAAALGTTPALLVAMCENVSAGVTSEAYPAPGTGFTSHLNAWNWNGTEGSSNNPNATLESRYVANPGTIAATFTARNPGANAESFISVGVAFQ